MQGLTTAPGRRALPPGGPAQGHPCPRPARPFSSASIPAGRDADRAHGARVLRGHRLSAVSAIYLSLFQIFTPTLQGNWVGLDNYRSCWGGRVLDLALEQPDLDGGHAHAADRVRRRHGAGAAPEHLVPQPGAQSLILFPYFISTVVAVLVWRWLFNDLYGILNHLMMAAGLIDMPLDYLGTMPNAMISVILVGAWKYFPFVVIAVLARLQTIPEALYEAAGSTARPGRAVLRRDAAAAARGAGRHHHAARDLGLQGIRPDLPADRRRPVTSTQTLPLLVYKEAFALQPDGHGLGLCGRDDGDHAGLHDRLHPQTREEDAMTPRDPPHRAQPLRLDDRAGGRLPAVLDARHLGQAAVRAVPPPADDPARVDVRALLAAAEGTPS
jgi:multiple sugar transport system permease protein